MEFAYVVDILEMKGRSMWPSECHHALRGATSRCFPGAGSYTDGEAWGLTWRIIQPIHRQRPDDFYPRRIHGNQKHGLLLVAWGMRVCFPHKHAELAARIQDACQERRETLTIRCQVHQISSQTQSWSRKAKASSRQSSLKFT